MDLELLLILSIQFSQILFLPTLLSSLENAFGEEFNKLKMNSNEFKIVLRLCVHPEQW